jgi:hypothetical protein
VFLADVVFLPTSEGDKKEETQSKDDRELHGLPPA